MSRAIVTLLLAALLAACTSPAPSRQLPDPAPDAKPAPAAPAIRDKAPEGGPAASEAGADHDVRTQMLLVQFDNQLNDAKAAYQAHEFDRSIKQLEEARETLERLQTQHQRDETTRLGQVSRLIEQVKRDRATAALGASR